LILLLGAVVNGEASVKVGAAVDADAIDAAVAAAANLTSSAQQVRLQVYR